MSPLTRSACDMLSLLCVHLLSISRPGRRGVTGAYLECEGGGRMTGDCEDVHFSKMLRL